MSKTNKDKRIFTSQPYPLYAWGMWVESVFDDEFEKIVDYEFNIDRLTIVGWMQEGGEVVPMVSSIGYGVVPLYAFTGKPMFSPYTKDNKLLQGRLDEEFILVEISLVEPDGEVYEVSQDVYKMFQRRRNKLTVVEEGPSVI